MENLKFLDKDILKINIVKTIKKVKDILKINIIKTIKKS